MNKFIRSFCLAGSLAVAAVLTTSHAEAWDLGDPAVVVPGDTYNITVVGLNTAQTDGLFLTNAFTATFGQTQVFTNGGLGGNVTVSSSEAVGATTTTDTFTISVPANFDPAGTTTPTTGDPVQVMFMNLGGGNAGTNPVNFLTPVTSPTYGGSMIYSGGTFNLNSSAVANALLTNGGLAFSDAVGINAGGSDLSPFAIRSFTITITYANAVPEPSTYAFVGAGVLGLGLVTLRRNRRARTA